MILVCVAYGSSHLILLSNVLSIPATRSLAHQLLSQLESLTAPLLQELLYIRYTVDPYHTDPSTSTRNCYDSSLCRLWLLSSNPFVQRTVDPCNKVPSTSTTIPARVAYGSSHLTAPLCPTYPPSLQHRPQ